jgi:hypothetical protein
MHLAKSNPAIDKGVVLKAKDASGKETADPRFPFIGPAPDLGCFEAAK